MSFAEFLNGLMSAFSDILTHFGEYMTILLNNNWFKIILFVVILGKVLWLIFKIIGTFFGIFDPEEDKKKVE